jgi:hypothetical protein
MLPSLKELTEIQPVDEVDINWYKIGYNGRLL